MTEDSWKTPIDIVKGMIEKWDASGQLPKVQLDPSGDELLSSKLRRTVEAARLAKAVDKGKDAWREKSGVFRAPSGLTDETPAMRAYLIECRKRQAQLDGKPYMGPVSEDRKADVWVRDTERWNLAEQERFHTETPKALGDMGLEPLEIELLPNLEQRWGAVAAVNMFIASTSLHAPKMFLVLGGKPGSGKTIAAASALLSCVETLKTTEGRVAQRWTRRGLFMKAAELSRLGNFGKEAEGAWERLRIRKLLIIDDLGNEAATEFWKDNFGNLVDARMRGEVKTIITTNLSGPELRERYGERVIRRLTDYGSFFKCEKPADPVAP